MNSNRANTGSGTDVGFTSAVGLVVERIREASGADIIALYPYDEETDAFYAPFASGLPEGDVVHSLPDMADQLRRFRQDETEGKISGELSPSTYGPNAWLLSTRRPLVAVDAVQVVESTFVRRHKIKSMLGLPLTVGPRMVGVMYLDYVNKPRSKTRDLADPTFLASLEALAADVALQLDTARHAEEWEILRSMGALVADFGSLPAVEDASGAARLMEEALHTVLTTSHLDAAAVYVIEPGGTERILFASHGAPMLADRAPSIQAQTVADVCTSPELVNALNQAGLHPLTALVARGQGARGVLVLADRDPLALHRRLPAEQTLLQTAADLLGAILTTETLLDALGESNRTLSAVTRLSNRLLQPGATQEQALRMAVNSLTDPSLPELDFELANIFLLEASGENRLAVSASAGAAASPNIQSIPVEGQSLGGATRRVPTWAAPGYRLLDPQDVMAYVARRRRVVVVAAPDAGDDDQFVTGYPEHLLARKRVPLLRDDGTVAGYVRAARLREAADRAPLRSEGGAGGTYRITDDFTLNAELFTRFGHTSLVRVFVPFGSDGSDRATGVLEAGFHISRERRLSRVQIEALRACAATIAVAVENARLFEEVTQRAQQLEIMNEVSRAIATSIDLEQTLALITRNIQRAVDASACLIALLDEDGSAWYGAAASTMDDVWRKRRVERPEPSIVFEVVDQNRPMAVENAQDHPLVSPYVTRLLGIRSLVALPLTTAEGPLGVVILAQSDRARTFTGEEVQRAEAVVGQAAVAIRNARLHAREEEEHHIQKDFVLVGFGQWGQKAYRHLVLLKNFFNIRIHVVEAEFPGRRETLAEAQRQVIANGDLFYWGDPDAPAHEDLARELEQSCYVITYIATPAETHLPMLRVFYDLSDVVLIEKPLGATPDEYRAFLETTDGSVQIVAADHYWFKLEVRLLELLLTEERNLRAFLDDIEEVEIEILEAQPPAGSGAQIGMIADLVPHAFAVLSLLTPLERFKLADQNALQVGYYVPKSSGHETYARLHGTFEHRGRPVRVVIDVGKGVSDAKWIKVSGERRQGGRRPFYKFDFGKGEAIDGTQSTLRAATREIRQPGVPDNAHLSMLRHVIERKNPAVGILSIREAIRANARIQDLEHRAQELLALGEWIPYEEGHQPDFPPDTVVRLREQQREEARS